MMMSPEILALGGLMVLLIVVVLGAAIWTRRPSHGPIGGSSPPAVPERPEDIAAWVLEGRRLFNVWQERIERLSELNGRLAGMAQEIEQLRAEVVHIDEMRAQITRLVEESERSRMERDRLREALTRVASLAHEAAKPSE
jgi:hypothetical protein